jgi:membrane protease YdiL (CAAX protease family)
MRAIITFSLFVVFAFVLGAVIAYPLKLLLDPLLGLAFRKYLTYATLISGLIVSGIYLQLYNLLSFKSFGYSGKLFKFLNSIFNGFIYGIAIMLIIEVLLYFLGIHEMDTYRNISMTVVIERFGKAMLAGLLIGLIEESIFRGALFSGLYKQTGAIITILFSSLIYSAVHFIRYREVSADTDIGWLTSFSMMPEAFRRFHEWSILDYFLTLFIFGILLGLLRLKYRGIAACIGVHAGIVTLIKTSDYFTNRTQDSTYNYLVSEYNSTFGWLSFVVILIFVVIHFIKLKINH